MVDWPTLDLHGIKHYQVGLEVENYLLLHDMPVRIITGNSPKMQDLVKEVVVKHGLTADYESMWNLGALIIY